MKIFLIAAICLLVFSGMAQESQNRSSRFAKCTWEEIQDSVRNPILFRASTAAPEKARSAFDELAPFLYIVDGKIIIQTKIPEIQDYAPNDRRGYRTSPEVSKAEDGTFEYNYTGGTMPRIVKLTTPSSAAPTFDQFIAALKAGASFTCWLATGETCPICHGRGTTNRKDGKFGMVKCEKCKGSGKLTDKYVCRVTW